MKINQAPTAIANYHEPRTTRMHRNHEEIAFEILEAAAPDAMTLKELTCRFNELTGYAIPDSSLCQPLNLLKLKGKIADTGPKRRCRINGITKKTWMVSTPAEVAPSDGNLPELSSSTGEDSE
jgi:hypothetical protein